MQTDKNKKGKPVRQHKKRFAINEANASLIAKQVPQASNAYFVKKELYPPALFL